MQSLWVWKLRRLCGTLVAEGDTWHWRQSILSSRRASNALLVLPCGVWHATHPSTFDRSMFEHEWAALFGVTGNTGFPVGLHHRGAVVASVGGMAIRTLHDALGNTVMPGEGECRSDVAMALIAEFRLAFFQKAVIEPSVLFRQRGDAHEFRLRALHCRCFGRFTCRYEVSGMTVVARHTVEHVSGMIESCLNFAGLVASQTTG